MVLFYSYVNVCQRVVGSWANTPAHWFPLAAYEKLAMNWWMLALTVRGAYLGRDGPLSAGIIDHLEGKKHPDHMAPQWRPMPQVWRHHLVHWRSGLSKASPRRSAVGCSGMLGY